MLNGFAATTFDHHLLLLLTSPHPIPSTYWLIDLSTTNLHQSEILCIIIALKIVLACGERKLQGWKWKRQHIRDHIDLGSAFHTEMWQKYFLRFLTSLLQLSKNYAFKYIYQTLPLHLDEVTFTLPFSCSASLMRNTDFFMTVLLVKLTFSKIGFFSTCCCKELGQVGATTFCEGDLKTWCAILFSLFLKSPQPSQSQSQIFINSTIYQSDRLSREISFQWSKLWLEEWQCPE